MKKLILQHWTGKMDEVSTLSSQNISKYAEKVGSKYKLLRGNVFRKNLSAPCQKLYMLDEGFDNFDVVVMIDADMFTRKGMEDDIFDPSITGIGMHTEYQSRIFGGLQRKHPTLSDINYPYWGGAIYKLDRETRQKLRIHIRDEELIQFTGYGRYEDEGIMHRLAMLAKLEKRYLPDNNKWSHGSFEPDMEKAAMIHIRHKVYQDGQWIPTPKIEVHRQLVERGLIEL